MHTHVCCAACHEHLSSSSSSVTHVFESECPSTPSLSDAEGHLQTLASFSAALALLP